MNPSVSPDPRILGLRIQEARKARGLTQQEVASELGLSRPTYMAIEKGERSPLSEELIRLADLLGRSIHELLRQREPVSDFVSHFRVAASRMDIDQAFLAEAATSLQSLCDDYLELETLTRSPSARHYPSLYAIEGRDPVEAAEEVAAAERNRLGVGDSPIPNLRDLLETDVGLRIFYLKLPPRIAGLFLYSERWGGCMAIHKDHPPGRRLWSLAHEYAHFLVHRYEAEVTVLKTDRYTAARERFADAFASAFLMPGLGLRRRFFDLERSAGVITPATLITLADLYGVSVEAMLLRLENLKLIPVGTWEALKEKGFRVKEAQEYLGLNAREKASELPRRYLNLAAQAHEDGLISEGELMRFLRTDREQARRMIQDLIYPSAFIDEGEMRQLNLTGPMGRVKE